MKRGHFGWLVAAVVVVLALGMTAPAAAAPFTATQSCEVTVLSSQQSQQAGRLGAWGFAVAGTFFGQHYSSIQTAVAAAQAGDTLLVEGTCTGTTEIKMDLTLKGEATGFGMWGMQPENPGATLDGLKLGSVLTIDGGTTVQIEGLTITGGKGHRCYGGGIDNNHGTVTIRDSQIVGNAATCFGGGIENYGGTLTLRNSMIEGNSTQLGGGIYNDSGGTLTIISSIIEGNSAAYGGGINNQNGALTITDSRIDHNVTTTGGYGGGIYNISSDTVTITGSRIEGNSDDGYGAKGGGIYNDGGAVNVTSSRIEGNSVDGGYAGGGGIFTYNTVTITGSRIDRNSALGNNADGGGVYDSGATVTMNHGSTIDHNTAAHVGGGIFAVAGTLNGANPGVNVYDNTPDDIVHAI